MKHLILALLIVLAPTFAAAHSKSETTTPADGTTVAEVPELIMRFDGPMRVITVTLSSGEAEVELNRETGMDPVTEFRAIPAEPLRPGTYTFDWRGMAADGHPMQGSFSFTVAE